LPWRWLGRVGYGEGRALQEAHRDRLLAGDADAAVVLLCEHDPVITIGHGAGRESIVASDAELAARGVAVVPTSRGGDVTYHGPGQLMVYPVLRLRRGVVAYLEAIAGALAWTATALGVPGAAWRRDPAGLWLGDAKLAACGLHLRRGVPVHGFALNVATPPEMWRLIVPCGLADARVTSLAEERARAGLPAPAVDAVAALAGPALAARLG
jgi:lipoate-protein ligase B